MWVALSLLAGVVLFAAGAGHAAGMDPEITQRFQELSLPVPALTRVVACHGFACKYRTEIGFDDTNHTVLKTTMAKAGATPDTERKAAAEALAWFGRHIAPETGTAGAKARAGSQINWV